MSRIKLDWTEQSADVEQRLTFVGGKKEICCNPSICLLRISNVVGCQVDNKEPHKVGSKHTLRSLSPLRFLLWGFSGRRWRVWQNNEERRERDFFLVFPFSFSNSKLKKWKTELCITAMCGTTCLTHIQTGNCASYAASYCNIPLTTTQRDVCVSEAHIS